ncbi:hypothetical protein ABPG74_007092 [Tetrahymena malaccensis]
MIGCLHINTPKAIDLSRSLIFSLYLHIQIEQIISSLIYLQIKIFKQVFLSMPTSFYELNLSIYLQVQNDLFYLKIFFTYQNCFRIQQNTFKEGQKIQIDQIKANLIQMKRKIEND